MKNPKIFIGENGFPENEGVDESDKKIAYHSVSIFFMLNIQKSPFFNTVIEIYCFYSREF